MVAKAWNNYWFQSTPLVNLAACRIVIVAFQVFWLLYIDYFTLFREYSALPSSLFDPLPALKIITLPFGWNYRPSFEVLIMGYWITIVAGILAIVGLWTIFGLLVFAIGNVFLQAYFYSFGDYHHPEAVLMIVLCIFVLTPAGKALSFDELRSQIKQNVNNKRFQSFNSLDKTSIFAKWPLLLTQWMLALIYLDAAMSKLSRSGLDWMNGYTLQYYLLHDGLLWDAKLGVWLAHQHNLVVIISWMSMIFEATFFFVLIFPKLAWIYVPMGIGFHTGIYMTMRAPFFQLMILYSVFVPWLGMIRFCSRRIGMKTSNKKAEILYDGHCLLCIRSMTVIRYIDWFNCLAYTDLETIWPNKEKRYPGISLQECQKEMHLLLPDGTVHRGFFAFRKIIRYTPLLWPLLIVVYMPGMSWVGPKVYHCVASTRARIQQCNSESCSIHYRQP